MGWDGVYETNDGNDDSTSSFNQRHTLSYLMKPILRGILWGLDRFLIVIWGEFHEPERGGLYDSGSGDLGMKARSEQVRAMVCTAVGRFFYVSHVQASVKLRFVACI